MQKVVILNTREIKRLRQKFVEEYGTFIKGEYAFLKNEKDRIFLENKDIAKVELKNLRLDKMGLYFCESKKGIIRLSLQGAAFFVQNKENEVKNKLELSKDEIVEYFKGVDLNKDLGDESKFVILMYEGNVVGCSKYKDGVILNYLPKTNRGTVIV